MSGLTVVRVNPPAYSAMLSLVLDLSRREQASLWQIGVQAAVDDFPNFDALTFVAGFRSPSLRQLQSLFATPLGHPLLLVRTAEDH
jgi:hypothetical protein